MKEVFDNYVKNYNIDNPKVKLKIEHSYRVMDLSKKYAEKLNFSDHDIKLATLIGLFHDIGRFEQIKRYNTFKDYESVDHASLSIEVLFDENLIESIWDNKEDYELIKFAIKNHNKKEIEPTTNERFLKHAKLIRDTDKIDIIYLEKDLEEHELILSDEDITKELYDEFMNHICVSRNKVKSNNDFIVVLFAFAFDINNDICLEELKENYKAFYNELKIYHKFDDIYKETIKYIDERLSGNLCK